MSRAIPSEVSAAQALASDPTLSAFVAANAGSGKTHVLVQRVIRLMLAGTVPESVTAPIRRFQPDHVILVDAVDMDKPPGTVQIVAPGHVEARFFSTHVLPLPVVMKFVADDTQAKVTLVGIQPDLTNESETRTPEEQAGLALVIGTLRRVLSACLRRQ
jgi:hydrogenase maturation protease